GRVPIVWHAGYEVDIGPHPFPTRKYRLVRDALLAEGTVAPADLVEAAPATDDQVALVHTSDYLWKIKTATLSVEERLLLEVPFSPALRDAACITATARRRPSRAIQTFSRSRCIRNAITPPGSRRAMWTSGWRTGRETPNICPCSSGTCRTSSPATGPISCSIWRERIRTSSTSSAGWGLRSRRCDGATRWCSSGRRARVSLWRGVSRGATRCARPTP